MTPQPTGLTDKNELRRDGVFAVLVTQQNQKFINGVIA